MRRIILYTLLLWMIPFIAVQAQVYLFNDFKRGELVYDNKQSTSKYLFNYELSSEKVHFKDGNIILELGNTQYIDYIKIDNDIFKHIKNGIFYQELNLGEINLYINRKLSVLSEGRDVGYGSKTQTTSTESIVSITSNSKVHSLDMNEDFSIKIKYEYYLRIDGKYKRFNSLNSLAKLFPKNKDDIQNNLKDKNLDFKKIEDVTYAVQHCEKYLKRD